MADTSIEWTDTTWNPVRGCSRVSPGCDNCYAMRMARRLDVPGGAYEGLTRIGKRGVDWAGVARMAPDQLGAPLHWRKPRRVFVNSMSDLFHESLSNEQIAAVFGVMAASPQHTFQVLTKRAKRLCEWFARDVDHATECGEAANGVLGGSSLFYGAGGAWPLPNVWLGVSAEDQQRWDERATVLARVPAAVRFVSAEPLLGTIEMRGEWQGCGDCDPCIFGSERQCGQGYHLSVLHPEGIHWVIVGGESGHGARIGDGGWIRSIVQQCRAADVPCFVKQMGTRPHLKSRKGGDPAEWPEDLRVREFPQ